MVQSIQSDEAPSSTRRSTRSRKAVQKFGNELSSPATQPKPAQGSGIKRKAKSSVTYQEISPLLEKTLAAITPEEKDTFLGWVPIESEPTFFQAMLIKLGVPDLKFHEAFSLDDLSYLPRPIHGLILLHPADLSSEEDENLTSTENASSDDLWFANQTTKNGCGTVALLNVLMNVEGFEFNGKLNQFLADTKSQAPPLRGHTLASNNWIRGIHNAVARRIDLLEEDVALDTEYQDADITEVATKPTKKKSSRHAGTAAVKKKKKKRKNSTAGAYHYIAYVPKDGLLWELDGTEYDPRCLGPVRHNDWTEAATLRINEIMERDQGNAFNLMAICGSPLSPLKKALASNLGNAAELERQLPHHHEEKKLDLASIVERLGRVGIDFHSVQQAARNTPDFLAKTDGAFCSTESHTDANMNMSVGGMNGNSSTGIATQSGDEATSQQDLAGPGNSNHDDCAQGGESNVNGANGGGGGDGDGDHREKAPESIKALYDQLAKERSRLLDEIEREARIDGRGTGDAGGDKGAMDMGMTTTTQAGGRQMDFTPAVFEWARTLAEKGMLRDLMAED